MQDGWQRPKARGQTTAESAQKYVLVAYDFARAYDVVDHRLLCVRLLELGLPHCMITWMWQWLRDRRVRWELNGANSSERVFRVDLPQGSVLSPPLFLLWAAPLVSALRQIPGCSPYMYADDTATLCAGPDITTARERDQTAADTLVSWARSAKMVVCGPKTQLLLLSQWARDAVGLTIKVGGAIGGAGQPSDGWWKDPPAVGAVALWNLRQRTADALAGEATALPQEEVPLDTRTVFREATRVARARTAQRRPAGCTRPW